MFVLFLVILLTGDEYAYGPEGPPHQFKTKAACEAQLKKSRPEVEKANPGIPLVFECRKV